jgi:hypothetical protein
VKVNSIDWSVEDIGKIAVDKDLTLMAGDNG